jgi:protein tyrosine phosphatase (PTP) superfamily phosphohydrolase (DUF442 family)
MFSGIADYTGLNYPFYYLYAKSYSYLQPLCESGKDITKITDELYISDYSTSSNKDILKNEGITHIITAVHGISHIYPDDFKYKNIPLIDSPNENIYQYFETINKYIDDVINNQNGKILIHCMCGASRSATILASYIIYKGHGSVNVNDAINFLKQKRNIIDPNPGYIKQLKKYYNELCLKQTSRI